MKRTTIKKGFNCLDFKQSSQEKIATEIKNLSHSEQIKYFKENIDESDLRIWWESLNT
ncbi:hypothetical protein WH8501_25250 [Crocosphaera watsonii WH 8501]|uniref:Uncharacterized protein n=5 Tax=Crocosphaera watsonii TaxID=263511 RepID=T2JZT7_CROWT|nr:MULTISPECIES: hypothetical protein [Crocosphaera]EHJ11647.1 hypothetical protein CWATWH0003_3639 [Crocosphaera watsonii WH 0003]MCH2245220.1 hypothetical protein [Crocosphaera sp.]NQZ60709.1 hypothetical protein [Crocosphaera sp.]CCQ49008.1 hypothetical protein CWATWH8502_1649 [Crocosphaera watsonii WH 8502]CCQ53992.1 hypothetical protein CWATWH0005_1604 [Crocosphaera watsonii WH 0005]